MKTKKLSKIINFISILLIIYIFFIGLISIQIKQEIVDVKNVCSKFEIGKAFNKDIIDSKYYIANNILDKNYHYSKVVLSTIIMCNIETIDDIVISKNITIDW